MQRLRVSLLIIFSTAGLISCFTSKSARYNIADSKAYEESLFKQNCSICHGPEGEGKMLEDGKLIPNLRDGEFKFRTDAAIYKHIAEGGNGMTPFRDQLTERELNMMVDFVQNELRGHNK